MGKGQSKHGECYLVNAHFNPLCQLEDTNSLQSSETPLTSKDSGLQLTPEISFTLSEDDKSNSDKDPAKQCALEVFLPQETVNAALSDSGMDIKLENSSIDLPSQNDHKISVECIQSENHSDEQEFSFVLRNYANKETEKEDSEKIILHSICDALKSTLKFPPSGNQTLKVHLTVSSGAMKDANEIQQASTIEESCFEKVLDSKEQTSSKFLPQESPDKTPSSVRHQRVFNKCCQQESVKNFNCNSSHDIYPSPHSKRHQLLIERKEARKWMDVAQLSRKENIFLNTKSVPEQPVTREKHYIRCEQQITSKDSSNYLDLADGKPSHPKENQDSWDPRYLNPAYCSPRHLEKSHRMCHYQKQGSQRKHITSNNRSLESELHSGILRYKLLQKAKHNLLDFSFDLCDLEEKQLEKTHHHHHRRSRSYDTNQYSLLNSPNLRHRNCKCSKCVSHCKDDIPPSPGRHHRHCHRKREKDKLRAMEQVARWLDQEEMNKVLPQQHSVEGSSFLKDGPIERYEYHHIHEHHHYHHYLDA